MFWDNFVKLCAEKNVKPNPVAKELGISSGAVTKWKKEGITPNSVTLQKIADYFGVSVDYLLGIEKKPTISDGPEKNMVVFHRDGKTTQISLSEEKMDMFLKMIDAVKDEDVDL